jgi:hypothetical protein
MYSFLISKPVTAAIKPETAYQWFSYKGARPVKLDFRGKTVVVEKGMRFGVRPSVNGTDIRLIFKGEPTKVHTLTKQQADKLAKGV